MSRPRPKVTRARARAMVDAARPSEAEVAAQCVEYAAIRGVDLERRNVMQADFGGRRVRAGRDGEPDYEATLPDGRRLCFEAKAPGKRPRPEQLARLLELGRGGAQAFWADSAEAFRAILDHLLAGASVTPETDDEATVITYPTGREATDDA